MLTIAHKRRKILLLFSLSLLFNVLAFSQNISLTLKNAPLEKAIREIEKQTTLRFSYTREQMQTASPVTIDVRQQPLNAVLQNLFRNQQLTCSIDDKYIIVKTKNDPPIPVDAFDVKGVVTDEKGYPLQGVSISVKATSIGTATNDKGEFTLKNIEANAVIVFTSVGYQSKQITLNGRTSLQVQLSVAVTPLDETVITAYGSTTKKLNTGSISRVTSSEIEKQPVTNPLAALEGRVPGMVISQTSGVPGSAFKVEIRGRTSLDLSLSKNDPLFIIDGVPFEPGNTISSQLTSAANVPNQTSSGGLSPLNSINPSDIESIEVLKDADATAIYGSRGANGVVLITTKKGKAGKLKATFNFYTGVSRVTRTMEMMNTQQYVAMRREAFINDGIVLNATNAPDIVLWDTTRYTDLKKLLIGNAAHTTHVEASVSGGSVNTQFLISSNYHRETTVYPGDFSDQVAAVHFSFNQFSADKKFNLLLSANYSVDNNKLPSLDLSTYLRQSPNMLLYDSLGNLNWQEAGVNFAQFNGYTNPLSVLQQKYSSQTENMLSNVQLNYQVVKHLQVRVSCSYNSFRTDETSVTPKTSINPIYGSSLLASSSFANSYSKSWIVEPQAQYTANISKGKIDVLIGGTWQQKDRNSASVTATNYTSDLLLYSMAAAGNLKAANSYSQYRYTAIFGRVNYNWLDKYLLNLTGRRDGSSRFGPNERFANFGAVGAGWIFSNENLFKQHNSFFSFGKIRGSYGLTGNDQIGDYNYLDLWNSTTTTYQGVPGLVPARLFNPDYNWEVNKKMEAGLEIGFLRNTILFNASYYRHRSNNQLVSYSLPIQAGFSTVVKNFPALVQNSGLEIELTTKVPLSKSLFWSGSFNITFPKNKLVSFPSLSSSSYASKYVEGEPLSVIRRYKFLGVDPATGIYTFEDVNKDGQLTPAQDYQVLGNTDPNFYGGFASNFSYKQWQLSMFFQFAKQVGPNYLSVVYSITPGTGYNLPTLILDHWQKPGDAATYQKYTQNSSSPAIAASGLLNLSNGIYSDASFIRWKNVSLSYNLPRQILSRIGITDLQLYVRGQNILTITNYNGTDPENQNYLQLPPLSSWIAGIQITF